MTAPINKNSLISSNGLNSRNRAHKSINGGNHLTEEIFQKLYLSAETPLNRASHLMTS